MREFLAGRLRSFGHAFAGLGYIVRTQKNAQIHLVITLAVIALGIWLSIPGVHWAVLLLTIALVWAAESLNTSIETVLNIVQPEFSPMAKTGKDVAAAAVLISAILAVIIGLIILGPPLWRVLTGETLVLATS
jgi:diacylglycerol kinase